MSFNVARLNRPYDFRMLIETYIYTQRKDFLHSDFNSYYAALLEVLQKQFAIRLSHEGLTTLPQRVFWMLFNSTVRSLLQITNPWANFLDETLLVSKLDENCELRSLVNRASGVIGEANKASEAAHREMLWALFEAIFGKCQLVVTSQDLLASGFDDSKEPEIANYYHLL